MVSQTTGAPFSFRILIQSRSQQKMLNGFTESLRKIGVQAIVRQVDSSEYTRRLQNFDYDMFQFGYSASLSPGNEQYNRWSSQAADIPGSWNFAGARSPAIDHMIDAIVAARDRPSFEVAVRAYDRTLLAGDYVIPLFHLPKQWVAHWKHLAFPKETSLYGYRVDTWWDTRAGSN